MRTSLGRGEVHLWLFPLDLPPDRLESVLRQLTPEEASERARLPGPLRAGQLASLGVTKAVLESYTGVRGVDQRIARSAAGKPEAGGRWGKGVRFSLSHSAGLALLAVALGGDVGVDLERVAPFPDPEAFAARFFTERDRMLLAGTPDGARQEVMLSLWTLKEARLKGLGEGVASIGGVEAIPAPGALRNRDPGGCGRTRNAWRLASLRPADRFVGAVAAQEARGPPVAEVGAGLSPALLGVPVSFGKVPLSSFPPPFWP